MVRIQPRAGPIRLRSRRPTTEPMERNLIYSIHLDTETSSRTLASFAHFHGSPLRSSTRGKTSPAAPPSTISMAPNPSARTRRPYNRTSGPSLRC